ncbi:MAG: hypothetical protein P4M04_15375 [Acidobacteriota bacterium]|nr:hypothetical protein [Acidobacteriota bacterium]
MLYELPEGTAAVTGQSVPNDQQLTRNVAQQMSEELDDLRATDRFRKQAEAKVPPGPGGMTNGSLGGAYSSPDSSTTRTPVLDSNGNLVDVLYIVSASTAGATNTQTKGVLLSTDKNPKLSVLAH